MKSYKPFILGGIIILVIAATIAGYFILNKNNSNSETNNDSTKKSISLDINQSLCSQIPSSVVQTAIGKQIINTKNMNSNGLNVCQYYIDATHFVTLRLNNSSYQNQKNGQTTLGRTISTDPSIHMEHFIAKQENGLINSIYLKINDNLFIAIDRSSGSTITEQNMLKLAADVADYLVNGINSSSNTSNDDSSGGGNINTQTDIGFIKDFFGYIQNKRPDQAVMVMTSKNNSDDSVKQAWAVQFNYMSSVSVTSVAPSQQDTWTNTYRQYKVFLDLTMNPNSASAPIPYYGYQNGQNTRWINLVKENDAWRIDSIATGP